MQKRFGVFSDLCFDCLKVRFAHLLNFINSVSLHYSVSFNFLHYDYFNIK